MHQHHCQYIYIYIFFFYIISRNALEKLGLASKFADSLKATCLSHLAVHCPIDKTQFPKLGRGWSSFDFLFYFFFNYDFLLMYFRQYYFVHDHFVSIPSGMNRPTC